MYIHGKVFVCSHCSIELWLKCFLIFFQLAKLVSQGAQQLDSIQVCTVQLDQRFQSLREHSQRYPPTAIQFKKYYYYYYWWTLPLEGL